MLGDDVPVWIAVTVDADGVDVTGRRASVEKFLKGYLEKFVWKKLRCKKNAQLQKALSDFFLLYLILKGILR